MKPETIATGIEFVTKLAELGIGLYQRQEARKSYFYDRTIEQVYAELAYTFDFTVDDLLANRQGQVTPRQLEKRYVSRTLKQIR